MPIQRLPLVGILTSRDGVGDTDQRFFNCFPEIQDKERLFVTKRPGLVQKYANTAGEGRGITSFEGASYHVIGNTIYKDGVALASTLSSSAGRVYFATRGGGSPVLIINDKADLYTLNTSDTLVKISDADYPADTVAGVEHLDQYVFVMDAKGIVYNSDVNAPTAYSANGFLTAEILADAGIRVIRHINYIVAMGSSSIEFFYDAANATGSPLSRLEGTVSLIGIAAGDTAVNIGQELIWVAIDQGGGKYVAKLTGFTPEPLNSKPVEEALDKAGSSVSDSYAYTVRSMGHSFYVLTIPVTGVDKTFVYSMTDKVWHEWTSFDGTTETYFTGIDATHHAGEILILDEDNGKVYTLEPATYKDDGNTIKFRGITERYDGGSDKNKFLHRLALISDRDVTTFGTVRIRWSDDDYQNFVNWRSFDVSVANPYITRCGKFKRRAFEYRFEEDAPMRLAFLEMFLREGHHGQ